MRKKNQAPHLKVHEDLWRIGRESSVDETPLLPPIRRRPWGVLVPLLLLLALIGSGAWAYITYVSPIYSASEKAYETNLATAEEYEGESVLKKELKDNCYSLSFNRESTVHSLCVSKELWDAQTEGEPFDITLLRSPEPAELPLKFGD